MQAATDTLGGLDVAVNNAGIEIGKPLVEQTEEEFSRLLDINVKGVVFGIKHQTPALVAAGGGVIVNMAPRWPGWAAPRCSARTAPRRRRCCD